LLVYAECIIVIMSESEKKSINWIKVGFVILYFMVFLSIVLSRSDKLFFLQPKPDPYNQHRFLWCFACSLLPFSVLAFRLRHHATSPFPLYITYYPFVLLAISALVFSACHIFAVTSGFVFYYLSFGLCAILAYLVDSFWSLAKSLISRAQ